jgi:hypothetical protein
MFDGEHEELAVSVALFYGFTEAFVCFLFLLVCWKAGWTHASPDEPFLSMILRRHQARERTGDPRFLP